MSVGLLLLSFTPYWNLLTPLYERVMSKFGSNSTETVRIIYNFRLFDAFLAAPFAGIFGTGFGTASYPYIQAGLIEDIFAFDPESTYVSYLFDTGILGVSCYLMFLFLSYKFIANNFYSRKDDSETLAIIYAGVCAIFFTSFFYHYILYATHMMILMLVCIWAEYNRNFNINDSQKG